MLAHICCIICGQHHHGHLFSVTPAKQVFGQPLLATPSPPHQGFYSHLSALCTSSFWMAQKLEKMNCKKFVLAEIKYCHWIFFDKKELVEGND